MNLPGHHHARQRALAWLTAEGIPHDLIYQKVKLELRRDAYRFRTWLDACC